MDNSESILEIKQDDIKNFWLSLFPELNSLDDLNDLLQKISNKNLDIFCEERSKNSEQTKDKIEEIFSTNKDFNLQKELDLILMKSQKSIRWAYFYKPILKSHIEHLLQIVNSSNIIENSSQFIDDIISYTISMLVNRSFRVLILETNIASMENKLKGKTKYDRSNYFCKTMLNDENYLKEIYNAYPELVRIMDEYTKNLFIYINEIISNTEKNYEMICKKLNNDKPLGKILSIEIGKGDLHNNNKSVTKIKFSTNTYLIYKPRKLDIELSFSNFIYWLNEKIPNFYDLKSCKCYTIDNCGWMEFIEHLPCKTTEEIGNFYQRMGQLLCILYTLNSKDCHYENIIANGQYPILIDSETLLHLDMLSNIPINDIETCIDKIIDNSVISIGLLPTLFQNYKTNAVMEVGGLSSANKKTSPFKTQIIKNFDADDIHVENVFKEIPQASNNPKINDVIVGTENYLSEIRNGFKETYTWIMNNKSDYIKELEKEFYNLKCRILYKNTSIYVELIETSYHPDLLHNRSDREIYFHRIGLLIEKSKTFTEKGPYNSEIKEMLNCDVPIFFVNVKDTIMTNSKNEAFDNIYKDTIFSTIKNKINNLSSTDLYRQISLINESFIGCNLKTDLPTKTYISLKNSLNKIKSDDILPTAIKLCDLIIERSIVTDINNSKYCSWIGLMGFGGKFYTICPSGNDLYTGNSGVFIFLSYLSKVLNQKHYFNFATYTLKPTIETLKNFNYTNCENVNIGTFSGIMSCYYSIYMAIKNNLFNEKESKNLIALLEEKLDLIDFNINKTNNLDIISGLSGVLGVLISIYDIVDNNSKAKILKMCGNILTKIKKSAINIDDNSITWTTNDDIGYAHGNCGITSQLMRLYNITLDKEILTLIKKSLNYERKNFNSKTSKWTFRENTHYHSWCNGIGGLLLSKLLLYDLGYSDDKLANEISLLINQLKDVGFGENYSICHGDIGSLALLYYAASILKDESLTCSCNGTLYEFNKNFVIENWSIFKTTEDWGLMTGASGVGLGLASLGKDQTIINILLLK